MKGSKIRMIFLQPSMVSFSVFLVRVCNGNSNSNLVQMGWLTDDKIGNSDHKINPTRSRSRKSLEDMFFMDPPMKSQKEAPLAVDSRTADLGLTTNSNPIEEFCKKVRRARLKQICKKVVKSQTSIPTNSPPDSPTKKSATKENAATLSPIISPPKGSHEKHHSSTSNSTHSSSKIVNRSSTRAPIVSPINPKNGTKIMTRTPTNYPTAIDIIYPSKKPTGSPHAPTSTPSIAPTAKPSTSPTTFPSTKPSTIPTTLPTFSPSNAPSFKPSTHTKDKQSKQHKPSTTNSTITPASNSTSDNDKQHKPPTTNSTVVPASNSTSDKDRRHKPSTTNSTVTPESNSTHEKGDAYKQKDPKSSKDLGNIIGWMIVVTIVLLVVIFCVTERVRVYFFLCEIYHKSGMDEMYPKIKGAFDRLRQKYGGRFNTGDASTATPPLSEITFLDESDHFSMNEKLLKRYI